MYYPNPANYYHTHIHGPRLITSQSKIMQFTASLVSFLCSTFSVVVAAPIQADNSPRQKTPRIASRFSWALAANTAPGSRTRSGSRAPAASASSTISPSSTPASWCSRITPHAPVSQGFNYYNFACWPYSPECMYNHES